MTPLLIPGWGLMLGLFAVGVLLIVLGYCNDNIDKHKTVEKMKQRCAELQRDLP